MKGISEGEKVGLTRKSVERKEEKSKELLSISSYGSP